MSEESKGTGLFNITLGVQSIRLSSNPVVGLVPNKLLLRKLPVFRLEPGRFLRLLILLLWRPCWCLAMGFRRLSSFGGSHRRAFDNNSRLDFRFRRGLRAPGSVWLKRRMEGLGGRVFDASSLPIDTDRNPSGPYHP